MSRFGEKWRQVTQLHSFLIQMSGAKLQNFVSQSQPLVHKKEMIGSHRNPIYPQFKSLDPKTPRGQSSFLRPACEEQNQIFNPPCIFGASTIISFSKINHVSTHLTLIPRLKHLMSFVGFTNSARM